MNHTGVKNVVTESTRVENKRERRRGAAGRAAVLRRAPSDSDCSGETASLSADSGDRAPRPPAVPPRSGKTRSRRRGSEWEVLEGLKDGQRFEKRPDVFNGYLHKKRKWPLKGWHKRFFVIDGGILVYARSPTDVARGRLHGSVDVGLSVISAKARRRRIDIDADEFIYHLRAKTPDVFRTWLNVLKTHRLYRQHLLTFGARESVPKIHAPLDDLPPTDTSSRTSTQVSTISSSVEDYIPKYTNKNEPCDYNDKVNNDIQIKEHIAMKNSVYQNHNSLCSMHCVSRRQEKQDLKSVLPVKIQQNNISLGSTDIEKQVLSTDLDMYSKSNDHLLGVPETENIKHCEHNTFDERKSLFKYLQATQAYYFFTHNKLQNISGVAMKRSKKSTNLVKYRNFFHEPILCRPVNGSILLNKGKGKPNKGVAINAIPEQESNEVQVALQDNESIKTTSEDPSPKEHDIIAQRVIISLFKNKIVDAEAKQYIKQVIGELYDAKVTSEAHPVRELFKSLLNYWLRNTSLGSVKSVLTQSQSIDRQSNRHFTEDKSLSGQRINWDSKDTQFHGLSDILIQLQNKKHNTSNKRLTNVKQEKCQLLLKSKSSPRRDTESFEKERRIQELEKIIKDTVYTVDTSNNTTNTHSKAKDIKITKTLIDNIGKLSQKTIVPEISKTTLSANDNSNSSTEKIQQTINHLISETAIPPDIAKEFLNAYLDVLIHDDNNLSNTSTQSSEQSRTLKVCSDCEVQTEDIMKKVTKSVTIIKTDCENPILDDDPGALYLKDILDKVTTIFSGVGKHWNTESQNEIQVGDGKENQNKSTIKEPPVKSIIYENVDDKSVVIDLTKYNLEHISMSNDPAVNGLTSIIIKLKESTRNTHTKQTRLKLKFSDSNRLKCVSNDNWLEYPINTETRELNKNIELRRNSYFPKEFDLRPYLSTSNVTSIPAQVQNKSEHSMCQSFNSSNALQKELYEEEHKSCYTLSFKSRILSPKCKTMKKITSKDSISKVLSTTIEPQDKPSISIFKKPVPRVIDEKFILLLLENLTLLAKNVPSLYTEINALYLKLSEKYQKISGSNIQRLNLLSRIYNGSDTTVKDAGIQLEKKSHSKIAPPNTQIGTNTSTVKFAEKTHVIHEILSAARFYVINNTSQTSREIKKKTDKETSSVNCQSVDMYADSFFVHVNNDDNNYRPLGTTNVWPQINHYKCVLNMNTTNNRLSEIKKQKRQQKFKAKSFLSPSSMVSIQSQTDKKRIRFTRDREIENNLKVYHLFKSNRFSDLLVNSISTSNIDSIFSDDMKTLYRCSSGPSFCSS